MRSGGSGASPGTLCLLLLIVKAVTLVFLLTRILHRLCIGQDYHCSNIGGLGWVKNVLTERIPKLSWIIMIIQESIGILSVNTFLTHPNVHLW